MFINFSNHPHALWSAEQQAAAQRYGTVVDLGVSRHRPRR